MAINTNFPNVRPSLLLDFANSQQLDPRVTFSRSTTAPYYDGKTSVLAEQNLLQQSNTFSDSYWYKVQVGSVTQNATAPDGTTTAWTLLASNTSKLQAIYVTSLITISASTNYVYSAYLQAGTNSYATINLQSSSSTNWISATFNLTTGVLSQSVGVSGTFTSTATPTITQIGSTSWYRCVLYFNAGSATTVQPTIQINNTATPSYGSYGTQVAWTGAGTETILIYGSQLEQRSSVTAYNATTTTAITNYIPQLLTAPINAPRFDFNPTTGESLGLLIEQSSTNIRTYSQDFTNGVWTGNRYSITANTIIAPDGTLTGSKLVESTATGAHYISTSATVTTSTAYTQSIYLKAGERTKVQFYSQMTGTLQSCIIDLTTGAISSNTFGTTPTMTSVGNNWWRFALTETSTSISSGSILYVTLLDGSGSNSYTGNGYSGVFLWQGQLEPLSFATSPIATTSAQVTRASDNASMTGTNFSSWYNNAQGTFYAEANSVNPLTTPDNYIIYAHDGTIRNRIYLDNYGTRFQGVEVSGNIINLNYQSATGVFSVNTFVKVGLYYQNNNMGTTYSGNAVTTISTGNSPIGLTTMAIGYDSINGNSFLNGRIKKIAYYPQAVTSAQLQALTGT
jgi:hypothetical protein